MSSASFRASDATSARRRRSLPYAISAKPARIAGLLLGGATVWLVLYPIYALVRRPLVEGDVAALLGQAGDIPDLGQTLLNTVILATATVALALIIGVTLAYAIADLPPRLAAPATIVSVFPMLIPPLAAGIGWIFMLSPDIGYANQFLRAVFGPEFGPIDVYTFGGIIFIPTLYVIPYVMLFTLTGLRGLDQSVRDAARICGASWFETQRRIVLPALRPALWYSSVIVALLMLGQFVMVLLFGRRDGIDVLTTEIFRANHVIPYNPELAAFLGFPLLLAAVTLVYAQNRFVGNLSIYGSIGKGVARASRPKRWPVTFVLLYALLAVVPPLAGLVIGSLSPFWSATVRVDAFTLDNFRDLVGNPRVIEAGTNSVVFSLSATVVALLVCTAIALILVRAQHNRLTRMLDFVVNLPLGVPAILFGLGVFIAFALGPVGGYGTDWVFIMAYVILVLPQGVRMMMNGLAQMNTELEPAARVSGAGRLRTSVQILVPLLRRFLAAAALIMFVLMINEFSASVMLSTSTNHVFMTQLYQFWEGGIYPQVAAMALLMVATVVIGSAVLFSALGGNRSGGSRFGGGGIRRFKVATEANR